MEAQLFSPIIIDFTPAPPLAPAQPVLSCIFPTHSLHHTVALDSGSEARYVHCQGRGQRI